jgi:hypothetical protein
MKIVLMSALLLILGVISCRKVTPLELPDGAVEVSLSCNNGMLDEGEDGIDCGLNNCVPCVLSLADCTLDDNVFTASFATTVTTAFGTGQVVSSTASGSLVVTATAGNKYVKVTFGSNAPQIFSAFPLNQFGAPSSNEAVLEYFNGSNLYTAYSSSDNVHLNKLGGKLSVEFCDVYMSTPSIGGYIVADGKITEN